MRAERWQRLQELLRAIDPLDPAARAAFLDEQCTDASMRAEVESLLTSSRQSEDYFEGLAKRLGVVYSDTSGEAEALAGRRIGPYRLKHLIGRGGMGAVFLAERADGQFEMQVAIKLMPIGMDTPAARARFLAERQVLAGLEHPNITRLLDGGIADDGTPYFVMEWIDGQRIDHFCDEKGLSIEERLRLFEDVCRAVQHAHQNLVVHRDLKPSNILVAPDGKVKLLDFGIARLISEAADGTEGVTSTGLSVLTPRYAAPEQLEGGRISTATDVYALGILLYALLTGTHPFAQTEASGGASSGVLDREPQSPSVAVNDRFSASERRQLSGDLDNIVLKALQASPERRYASAQQLLDDLERRREGLPVIARPDTAAYRIGKFAKRHRAGLLMTAAGVTILAAFGTFHTLRVTRERDVARAETAKARASVGFLRDLLSDAYPSVALGEAFSMEELLGRAISRIDSLSGQPELEAELLLTLGDIYREQGRLEDARNLLGRAVATQRDIAPGSKELGSALSALGQTQYEARDYEAALATHREELVVVSAVAAPDDSITLYALNNVAATATALGLYDEARGAHETVLARRAPLFADSSELVIVTRSNLATLYDRTGDLEAAARETTEVLRIRRELMPGEHPAIGLSLNNLGNTLRKLGRLDEAEDRHREALGIWQSVYGHDHPRVALSSYNLALVLGAKDDWAEASSLYRTTVRIDRATYGSDHPEVGGDLRRLGHALRQLGDCGSAVEVLGEAESIFEQHGVSVTSRRRFDTRKDLGGCLGYLGRYEEAETILLATRQAVSADPEANPDYLAEISSEIDMLSASQPGD